MVLFVGSPEHVFSACLCLLTTPSSEITAAVMQFIAKGRRSLRSNCTRSRLGREKQQGSFSERRLQGRAEQRRTAARPLEVTRERSLASRWRELLSFTGAVI